MAKRKINKTKEVQTYLAKHPDHGPTTVAAALKKYAITPSFVSNVKTKLKHGGKRRRTEQRRDASQNGNVDGIIAAASLIKTCRRIAQAKQALRAAGQVADAIA